MSYPVTERRGVRRAGQGGAFALPASWLYAAGAGVFHALHDRGLLASRRVRLPVISVGSLTVGGAGKTPITRWLVRRLLVAGRRPAVLSRGYGADPGRDPRIVDPDSPDPQRDGDEPALLARALAGVPVIVGADRARSASVARGEGADVAVLDDGMQHRRLARDVEIVLWDRTAEASAGRLIPRGSLREPRSGLRRAQLLLLVDRGDGAPSRPECDLPDDAVFRVSLRVGALQALEEGDSVHAISGIASPESFERSLESLGLRVTGATRFPDHHPFTATEVRAAAQRAAAEGASFLATTAKDRVRWPQAVRSELPMPAVFDLDVEMPEAETFVAAVLARLPGGRP